MKVYKLILNEVHTESPMASISSYISPRTTRKEEFYASKDSAQKRQKEIYDGLMALVGFFGKYEVLINEIDVKE